LPLTSQIKELEEILDFGIQKLNKFEPGLIQINNDDKHLIGWRQWRCGCPRTWGLRGWARCSDGNEISETNGLFSQELEKQKRKESCFKSLFD
jgi:hypothetical protein